MKNNKYVAQAGIAFVCLLLGFAITLQFKSVEENAGKGTVSGLRASELQMMYQKEKEKNEALYKDYERIVTDFDSLKKATADINSTTKLLTDQLDYSEILAGMKEVEGQGVTITMSDSKQNAQPGVQEELYWLHDGDILLVVNELRSAGAEAISINDERLTSASEIRCVGPALMVNNIRTGEPFVIKAIGDAKTLESSLTFRGGIVSELTSYGIGFEIRTTDKMTIPAYKGAIDFKYATPVKKGGAK